VGGGIGGMAAANALLRRGGEVDVYEQAPAIREVGAGVALHPNGVRMLRRLGLDDELRRWGARWTDPQFRRWDGSLVAPWWPPGTGDGIEIYGMHRADLLQMLLDRVPADRVHVDHRCVAVAEEGDQVLVSFANGSRAAADVLVGADGIHSTVQQYVTAPPPPRPSGSVAYRGLIPAASVSWPAGQMRNWLGPAKHFLVFPVRSNQLVNYVGFIASDSITAESWSAPGDPAQLAREFAGWDPMVEAIIAQVTATFWWGLYDREPLPRWSRGRVTLLGDAAHPMLPHVGQGANQAIEDALALAAVLAEANPQAAPRALQLYEKTRREHTIRVQASSRANGVHYDGATGDLVDRDRQLSNQARDRAWMWNSDPEAAARRALAERS
jgi:salicylate hydroxylase